MMFRKGLAVAVILLFIGICVVPSTAVQELKDVSTVSFDGNTLYVGGSGQNNYTTIQGAIDDALDGDTVFVYDDSSPYYENININKKLKLIGENKDTTIIDGINDKIVVNITTNGVTVSGFTIQRCAKWYAGIVIRSNYNIITGNMFINDDRGILILYSNGNRITDNYFSDNPWYAICLSNSNYNYILDNIIENCHNGIALWGGTSNILSRNSVINCDRWGIELLCSKSNKIFQNHINNSDRGVMLWRAVAIDNVYGLTSFNVILRNDIINNKRGIRLESSSYNIISQNNLMNNSGNANFDYSIRNFWLGNYWDDWDGTGFERINGTREIFFPVKGDPYWQFFITIPWTQYDWNPASEPYDIGV